jgi:nicotinamide-nucleotide amidase
MQNESTIIEADEKPIESKVAELLISKKLTISTAESCTGGLLSARLINYPGISSVFMEGAITYSNEAKVKRLGVKNATLKKFGAVSHETAKEMAEGMAKAAGTDIGVSVTGIAGPDGGTAEKPVGLVYVGLYIKGIVKSKQLNLSGNRQEIRNKTAEIALEWLKNELLTL